MLTSHLGLAIYYAHEAYLREFYIPEDFITLLLTLLTLDSASIALA